MTKDQILKVVQDVIAKKIVIAYEVSTSPETSIVDDLGADSLDELEIMCELEDIFAIKLTDEEKVYDWIRGKNIQDIVDFIYDKQIKSAFF